MPFQLRQYQNDIIDETKPKTRAAAKNLGVKRYFTGRPCIRGHISERSTSKGTCLACLRGWRSDNIKEVRKQRLKSYYKNHQQNLKRCGEYYRNNKSTIIAKQKSNPKRISYHKAYLKSEKHIARRKYLVNIKSKDPKQNLSNRMRCGIWNSIKSNKGGNSWQKFVEYDLNKLMSHLESKFLEGMTWENMGEWHIDHKLPITYFNFESPNDEDFKKCWALSNLRPLWAKDNISKHNKVYDLFA